jgi:hypothetical protein
MEEIAGGEKLNRKEKLMASAFRQMKRRRPEILIFFGIYKYGSWFGCF